MSADQIHKKDIHEVKTFVDEILRLHEKIRFKDKVLNFAHETLANTDISKGDKHLLFLADELKKAAER